MHFMGVAAVSMGIRPLNVRLACSQADRSVTERCMERESAGIDIPAAEGEHSL